MVVDSHAHVFQHWQGACGHPSSAVHLKYLQKVVTRPAARTYRVRDGARVAPTMLFREGDNTWAGLTDVDFRVGRFGQLAFTHEGEDYFVQYLPVGMQELACPPELMLAQMINAGRRPLHPAGGRRLRRDERLQRVRAAPASGQVHGAAERRRSHGRPGQHVGGSGPRGDVLGLRGLYYAQDFSRHGYARNVDDEAFVPFWDKIVARKLPVFIELSSTPTYDRGGYLGNLAALDRLLARYPAHPFLLVMGPPVAHFGKSGAWQFPADVLATYRRDNLWLEVMFPITWGGVWDYPYPEAQALIRGMRDTFGAGKLVWGSDMPNVERFCTYRQCVDYVRRHCDFLSPAEKDAVLGGNVAGFLALQ
jgi:predicted TIM-barrel fold metal-dependent hydrolase